MSYKEYFRRRILQVIRAMKPDPYIAIGGYVSYSEYAYFVFYYTRKLNQVQLRETIKTN
jgi:hypothetical protein